MISPIRNLFGTDYVSRTLSKIWNEFIKVIYSRAQKGVLFGQHSRKWNGFSKPFKKGFSNTNLSKESLHVVNCSEKDNFAKYFPKSRLDLTWGHLGLCPEMNLIFHLCRGVLRYCKLTMRFWMSSRAHSS